MNRLLLFLFSTGRTQLLISLGAALGFMVLLMLIGKVPVSYNVRNLLVRWKTTLMTALAFTLVQFNHDTGR